MNNEGEGELVDPQLVAVAREIAEHTLVPLADVIRVLHATPTKRGFGELKPPLVWSAKSKLPQIWDCPLPTEPYVDVCQYVRPSQRWVRRN